jgi:hypothetical protein
MNTQKMKRLFPALAAILISMTLLFLACDKKEKSTGIGPTYGSTGNPNPNNQTVTGSTTFSNPATQNSQLQVSGGGWQDETCIATGSLVLKRSHTDGAKVSLTFASVPQTGTYAISTVAGSGACAMTIVDAPSQPKGIVWVGKSGSVNVTNAGGGITATFTNVVCTQQSFNFPQVVASGTVGCN